MSQECSRCFEKDGDLYKSNVTGEIVCEDCIMSDWDHITKEAV